VLIVPSLLLCNMGDCSLASILTFIAGVIMGTGSTLTIKVCVCVCQKRGAHKGMKRANVPSQITNQCRAKNPCSDPLATCGSLSYHVYHSVLLPEQIAYQTNSTGLDGKVKVFGTCPPSHTKCCRPPVYQVF
jgi:hypothetical protein